MKRLVQWMTLLILAAFAAAAQAQAGKKVEVLWLGQAAFRITTPGGKVIVIDPWLKTNPKTPAQFKDLAALGKVDLVLVTHAHFDHVADAAELAKLNKAKLYAPPGLSGTLTTLGEIPGDLAPGMNKSGIATPLGPEIKFHMVRAEHSSEYRWKDPASGKEMMLPGGEPVGWIIELENGFKIYHMGDTGLFGDMKFIGEFYKPDLVLIPIGGNFTINAQLAGYAIREMIKPKFTIPMHYGTYPILAGKPEDFVKALSGSSTQVIVPQPGEKVDF
ncbi:MAG: metal-dependent hydrolase [Betaproteobacteria bacterium]|nr:metal-dependent hydrolase [Betaproteobacteria bacterium]